MEIVRERQKEYEYDILLIRVNGKLQELRKQVKDCEPSFVTAKDKLGMLAYQRSVSLMMPKTLYSMTGPSSVEKLMIGFSIGRGFFVEARENFVLDQEFLDVVKARIRKYVERKIPTVKRGVSTGDATELFGKLGMCNKVKLFRYRMVSRVNIYSVNGFEGHYYGCMMQNTGYIKHFDLIPYHYGFVMVMPDRGTPDILHKFTSSDKLFAILSEFTEQSGRMDLKAVGTLNDRITRGDMSHLVLMQEALREKKVTEIAAQIIARKDARFVMVTGSSSSDRTTFSRRLSVQLEAISLKPHPITMNNYSVNRVDSPRDEHGNYDHEVLECLDMKLFNRDMTDFLEGKRMESPYYSFKKGVREYKGSFLQLGEGNILVIGGICCLNDRLPYTPPADSKFKVYISALTQLNIDEYSRTSTTDGRFLRRMVRDVRTRGSSARGTIRTWSSVRRDERENILLFQGEADAMLDSAFIYELAVLKQYAQPLFFVIPWGDEERLETKRLLKFLDHFIGVSSEGISGNSILREFIGGSCLST